jgi:hypothetical protein
MTVISGPDEGLKCLGTRAPRLTGAKLVQTAPGPERANAANQLDWRRFCLVAGPGFEPATFRL